MYKSAEDSSCRCMRMPHHLVQMILQFFPQPGVPADKQQEEPAKAPTMGFEALLRVTSRLWELLGDAHQPGYFTADSARDARVLELEKILEIFGVPAVLTRPATLMFAVGHR